MASSEMLRHVALVRTDVSVELSASFIRVARIGELGITLSVTSNRKEAAKKYQVVFLEGGATFLLNVGSYKSHTAEHPRSRHSSGRTHLEYNVVNSVSNKIFLTYFTEHFIDNLTDFFTEVHIYANESRNRAV
jgi:hypothetical protein